MAEAISSAEQSAKKSPTMLPVPMPSNTMIRTPTIITAMVTSVTGRGRSSRNIQDSRAANIGGEGEDEDEVGGRGVVDGR